MALLTHPKVVDRGVWFSRVSTRTYVLRLIGNNQIVSVEVCDAVFDRANEPHLDPVLLCDEIGAENAPSSSILSSGRTTLSVKEAVRVATSNNFMGLICSSRLLVCPSLPCIYLHQTNPCKVSCTSSHRCDQGGKSSSHIRCLRKQGGRTTAYWRTKGTRRR